MLYHLFEWFKTEGIQFPGSAAVSVHYLPGVAGSYSYRCYITTVYGKKLINYLQQQTNWRSRS